MIHDGSNRKAVVLVVDMQERYFVDGRPLASKKTDLVSANKQLLETANEKGWPVIFMKEEYLEDFSDAPVVYKKLKLPEVIIGDPMAGIVKELLPFVNDNVIVKKRHSSFDDTDLRERLFELNITDVIVTGVNTDTCVLSTVIGARMDFDVIVPRQCVASSRPDMHELVLELLECKGRVMNLEEVLRYG